MLIKLWPCRQVWKIWPLGNLIHQFMNAFTDHRDSEILIVRHECMLFLLLTKLLPFCFIFFCTDTPCFFCLTFFFLFRFFSHFSLLLGCALPKWMSSGFNDRPLAPFAGILSLGIGDTMVSAIFLTKLVFRSVVLM